MLFIMNFSNVLKRLMMLIADNKWSILTMYLSQNVWNESRDIVYEASI